MTGVVGVTYGGSFLWGAAAASSLLLGAVLALRLRMGPRSIGWIMAFGSGVLISAVAFDLVQESFELAGGGGGLAGGLFMGCFVFSAGDVAISRLGTNQHGGPTATTGEAEGGLAIVLGAVLDGVPESMVIGLTLLEGGSIGVAYIAAVFLSNLPEGISATRSLVDSGWSHGRVLGLWALVVAVAAVASLAGYTLLETASDDVVAFVQTFAGGAILTMLSTTMMPEAYEQGGYGSGVATTLGFATAYGIHVVA